MDVVHFVLALNTSLEVSGLDREVFHPLLAHSEQSYSCCGE